MWCIVISLQQINLKKPWETKFGTAAGSIGAHIQSTTHEKHSGESQGDLHYEAVTQHVMYLSHFSTDSDDSSKLCLQNKMVAFKYCRE